MTAKIRRSLCTFAMLGLVAAPVGSAKADSGSVPEAQGPTDLADYVAYWDFDEASGSSAFDASPLDLAGDLLGGSWGEGINGSAVDLDGTDDFISITNDGAFPSALGSLTEGTLSIWFKFDTFTTEQGTIHPILFAGAADGSSGLIIEVGHFSGVNAKLYFTIYNGGYVPQCFDTGFDLRANTWYHFVAVVGADFNTGYLNGTELTDRNYNFGDASSAFFFSDVANKEVFWLGRGYLNERSRDQYLDGTVDEFRVYDRPLSAEEVRQHYESVTGSAVGCQLDPATSPDLDGDGVPDECCIPSAPARPSGGVATNRFLGFELGGAGTLQAVRVVLDDLPPPYDDRNGSVMWVGPPRVVSELPGVSDFRSPIFRAATLQCEPHFGDFGSLGPISVYHRDIVPGASYELSAIKKGCGMDTDFNFSSPVMLTTTAWGDIGGQFTQGRWSGPDGNVDVVTDVVSVVAKFGNALGAPAKARADLHPATPDLIITISDIVLAVEAFRGSAFPFDPGPPACGE